MFFRIKFQSNDLLASFLQLFSKFSKTEISFLDENIFEDPL